MPMRGFALRLLVRDAGRRGAIIALALGVATAALILSVVESIVAKPWPFDEVGRIVAINEVILGRSINVSYPNYLDWRSSAVLFERMAIAFPASPTLLTTARDTQVVSVSAVESSMFEVFGVEPRLGRMFGGREEEAGGPPVAVISFEVWLRHFGGRADALGLPVVLDDVARTVVGVLPPDFAVLNADVWIPLGAELRRGHLNRRGHPGIVFGRLKDDVRLEEARHEVATLAVALQERYPEENRGVNATVIPYLDAMVGGITSVLGLLEWAAVGICLVACVNFGGFLWMRHANSCRDLAIRAAFGAGWHRLAQVLLAEAAVVSSLATALGLALALGLAYVATPVVGGLSALSEAGITHISVDARTVVRVWAGAMIIGAAIALLLAGRVAFLDVMRSLRTETTTFTLSSNGIWWRHTFLAVQIAIALALSVGTLTMVATVNRLAALDRGFEADGVSVFDVEQPYSKYNSPDRMLSFARRIAEHFGDVAAVTDTAVVWPFDPGVRGWTLPFQFADVAIASGEELYVSATAVTPGFFDLMGIGLLRGRLFQSTPVESAITEVVVSQEFVNTYLQQQQAVGRRIVTSMAELSEMLIVGVVGSTIRSGSGRAAVPELYLNYVRFPAISPTVLIKSVQTKSVPTDRVIRDVVSSVDSAVAPHRVRLLSDIVDNTYGDRAAVAAALGVFSVVAIGLSILGVSAVVRQLIGQRLRELAMRSALGATTRSLVWLVLRSVMIPVGVGTIGGLGLSMVAEILLSSMVVDVVSLSMPALFGSSALVCLVTVSVTALRAGSTIEAADCAFLLRS